jgi:hypothetical protein
MGLILRADIGMILGKLWSILCLARVRAMDTHQLQPYRPGPPAEEGRRLATFPRNRGDEELRVTLSAYNGHDYIALRVWARGQDGEFWPVRGKGCSVRLSEAGELARALAAVSDEYRRQGRDRPASRGTSTWHRPSEPQRSLPAPRALSRFSEFDEA